MRFAALTLFTALFLCSAGLPAWACFGPKLYIGVGTAPEEQFLHALVALYVKEKTGVEMEPVRIDGKDGITELRAERLDLIFVPDAVATEAVLAPQALPSLLAARRVREDLQFTTVVPALRKLDRLLVGVDLRPQVAAVARGEAPAATARAFLTAQGWL